MALPHPAAVRAPSRHSVLELQVIEARQAQLQARIDWARSPNSDTINRAKMADRELDVLLDRLCIALRSER